jgi:hypothetical protein
MDTQSSLPHWQHPATRPYSEPDRSSLCSPSHYSKIHFNIILSTTPGSCKWSPSLRFPHQNPVCTSPLPHTSCPSHSRFVYPNNISWGIQSIKLFSCSILYSAVTSSLLSQFILLITLSPRRLAESYYGRKFTFHVTVKSHTVNEYLSYNFTHYAY